jgi:CheY-like chemotaxis protein
VINGYSDLILNEAAADAPMRKHADEVRKAGEQAAALTRQLLAFGRKQISQPAVLDVNAIVEGNSKILRRVIGENIDFATSLEPGLWQVRADPGQLEQVLMNLAVNARDAMPRGGKLLIQTANVMLQENGAQSPESRSLSPHVMIAVTDTGCGMDADTRSRIFEPFFTTKGLGRGTGLGLSIVYGIVKQGGGEIEVMSEPGMGTTFKVYFPRCEAVRPAAGTARVSDMPAGSETILVVEDDSVIRNLVTMILQKGGYTVLKARNGKDALQICAETLAQIGLVLTDLVMPQMSGPELVHEIKSRIPEVKVLYTSGYADGSLMQDGNFDPEVPFIQKPFSPASLLRKVRQVLDGVADDAAVSYQG